MQFNKVAFWIQLHNVPLLFMNKEIGKFLGEQLGDFKEIDLGISGDCLEKYLRVRTAIDITQPLRRILRANLLGNDKNIVFIVELLVTRLENVRRLILQLVQKVAEPLTNMEPKPWLRATRPVKIRNSTGPRKEKGSKRTGGSKLVTELEQQ
ncbi:hypothetical protein JRO89_XS10G0172000 [Xanthoceras sorbifolium]|uniref:DUF4283 domain-containing protein n=1 Tax=Xanthoceras sorbifolium TaxID=99658 RepID=A0ABQ8HJ44_9ROSI|nr:hypothetical protein JRO89_XS10G0172000 [Xanthoceras sorbifolium]